MAFDYYMVLSNNEPVKESLKLAKLHPSIYSQGLMQMNARLDNHNLYPEQIMTSIILRKEQMITEHIVLQIHRKIRTLAQKLA